MKLVYGAVFLMMGTLCVYAAKPYGKPQDKKGLQRRKALKEAARLALISRNQKERELQAQQRAVEYGQWQQERQAARIRRQVSKEEGLRQEKLAKKARRRCGFFVLFGSC